MVPQQATHVAYQNSRSCIESLQIGRRTELTEPNATWIDVLHDRRIASVIGQTLRTRRISVGTESHKDVVVYKSSPPGPEDGVEVG